MPAKSGFSTVTISGYFNDWQKAATAAAEMDGRGGSGVYFTPNPVKPECLARAANRLFTAGRNATTKDFEILRRRYLLVDLDPVRVSGISSSSAEKDHASLLASKIRTGMADLGWPEPLVADSGNGIHLVYEVDLENNEASRLLAEQTLKSLAKRFDTENVKIDTCCSNAGRIWKLYGTHARKGENTPDRPHRTARVLHVPETWRRNGDSNE